MNGYTSVIIVNYNGTEDTNSCIESLLSIDDTNFNIIVVDNGSDEVFQNGCKFNNEARLFIIRSDINIGFSGGNNLGIKFALSNFNPDYILLLNNDTVVTNSFLDSLISCSKSNPNAAIVCGKIMYYFNKNTIWYAGGEIDYSTGWTQHYGANEVDNGTYDIEQCVSFATGCLMLIPKWAIEQCGVLDESYFLYFEDAEYCCRIISKSFSIVYCPKSVIYHKVNASTKKNGKVFTYYFVRNSLFFIKKYGTNRLNSYIRHLYHYAKDVIKGRSELKIVVLAIIDFINNKSGYRQL